MKKKKAEGLPKDHISYTQIRDFVSCPLFYKIKYHDGIKQDQNKAMKIGFFLHEVARQIVDKILATSKDDFSFEEAEEIYDKTYQDFQLGWADYSRCRENIRNFALKTAAEKTLIVAAEAKLIVDIGEVKLLCRIDRIDAPEADALEIIDYKSSPVMPSEAELRDDLQGQLYALAVQESNPHVKRIFFSRQSLASYYDEATEELKGGYKKKIQIDIVQLKDIKHYLKTIWERIKTTKDWQPTPDIAGICAECPKKCPTYSQLIDRKYPGLKIGDINEVANNFFQIYNQKAAVEKHYKDLKAILEGFFARNMQSEATFKDFKIYISQHFRKPSTNPGGSFHKINIKKLLTGTAKTTKLDIFKPSKGRSK